MARARAGKGRVEALKAKRDYRIVLGEMTHCQWHCMEVARLMDSSARQLHEEKTGQILREISEDEVPSGRPMLSALAVSITDGVPSWVL